AARDVRFDLALPQKKMSRAGVVIDFEFCADGAGGAVFRLDLIDGPPNAAKEAGQIGYGSEARAAGWRGGADGSADEKVPHVPGDAKARDVALKQTLPFAVTSAGQNARWISALQCAAV